MSEAVLLAIVGFASAALGGPGWSYLSKRLELGVVGRRDALADLRSEVANLKTELVECEARHETLETRLRAVEHRNASYFAMWIKDRQKRLVWMNDKAFLTIFAPLGLAREGLDGKTFAELLDPYAAKLVDRLDQAALAHPGETQADVIQLHPELPFLVVIKVASIAESGEVQFEGCAYRPGDPEIRDANSRGRQHEQRALSAENLIGEV